MFDNIIFLKSRYRYMVLYLTAHTGNLEEVTMWSEYRYFLQCGL